MTRNEVRPKTETIFLIMGALALAVIYRRAVWLRFMMPWVLRGVGRQLIASYGQSAPAPALLHTSSGGTYDEH